MPAPLCPSSARTSPRRTSRLSPSTAVFWAPSVVEKTFVRLEMRTAASLSSADPSTLDCPRLFCPARETSRRSTAASVSGSCDESSLHHRDLQYAGDNRNQNGWFWPYSLGMTCNAWQGKQSMLPPLAHSKKDKLRRRIAGLSFP